MQAGCAHSLMTRAAGRHYNGAQEAARRVDIPGENRPKVGNEKTNEKQTETKPEEKEETLDELMEQLDSLIGLDTVKHEVRSLINLIKVRAMRKEHDLKVMNMSFHMVLPVILARARRPWRGWLRRSTSSSAS